MKLSCSIIAIGLFLSQSAFADDRLLKVINDRLNIKSISVQMEIKTPMPPPGRDEYQEITRSYEIDMIPSKDLFREVRHWNFPSGSGLEILLRNESGYLTDRWGDPGATLTTSVDEERFIDVRMLGFVVSNPSSLTGRLSEEIVSFFAKPHIEDEDTIEDRSVSRAIYQLSPDRNVTIWYSTDVGDNPVRIRFDFEGKYAEQIDTKYEKFNSIRNWFPTEVEYRQYDNQEKLISHEIARLSEVFFNCVEDSVFETKSLPIKNGRRLLTDGGFAKRFNVRSGTFEDSNPTDVFDLDSGTYVRLGSIPTVRTASKWVSLFVVSLLLAIVVARRLFMSRQIPNR